MMNLDVLAMWGILAIIFVGVSIPIWFIINNALTVWFQWYRNKFYQGKTMEDCLTDELVMKSSLYIGSFMIIAPCLIILAYMHLTGMSIPEMWAHQFVNKWRW